MKNIPLNRILYGPPGTGKTYNTVVEAIKILDNDLYKQYSDKKKDYSDLKKEFDKLKEGGQIEFVTFHQSYSYEEFVEGIKPCLGSWNESIETLAYQGSDGLFKRLSRSALSEANQTQNEINDFNYIKNLFIKEHVIGSTLKTKARQTEFRIKEYTDTGVLITPTVGTSEHLIYFKHLEKAFNECMETQEEIGEIRGVNNRRGYYYSIHEELLAIKKRCNKNIILKNHGTSKPYVLIIDEINRGNISKIFGELITLIEEDKRENLTVKLPYSKQQFTVPKNLYIIGTMNTSDRSIASIDIALRRRFKFTEMMPQKNLVADFGIGFNKIFDDLNKKIKILLDRDHQIGHSYFINTKYNDANGNNDIETLKEIWFSEILPLLNEYFYSDWDKLKFLVPGFITKLEDVPVTLKNEYDDAIYEFKTFDEIDNFEEILKQEEFMDN